MSTIVTRAGKGSSLTWVEGDANVTNLNTDKYQSGDSPTFVTINGTTLNISGSSTFLGATYYQAAGTVASGDWRFRTSASVMYQDYYNGSSWSNLISYASFGVGITNTLNVGTTLTVGGASIAQNSQSDAYTLVASDANKHILHPSADTTARIYTIPANASVAFAVGTAVTFVNQNSAGVITIAITSDTMRLAGAGTTGSRTLAANGVATALKITTTEWIISGTGLT